MKNSILKFINDLTKSTDEQEKNNLINAPLSEESAIELKDKMEDFENKIQDTKLKALTNAVSILSKEVATSNKKLEIMQEYLLNLQTSIEILTNALFESGDETSLHDEEDDKNGSGGGMVN